MCMVEKQISIDAKEMNRLVVVCPRCETSVEINFAKDGTNAHHFDECPVCSKEFHGRTLEALRMFQKFHTAAQAAADDKDARFELRISVSSPGTP